MGIVILNIIQRMNEENKLNINQGGLSMGYNDDSALNCILSFIGFPNIGPIIMFPKRILFSTYAQDMLRCYIVRSLIIPQLGLLI